MNELGRVAPVATDFTVLVAVYHKDDPAQFGRALASVFANSLLPDAVIIVADGPLTPELDAVLSRFAQSHTTLRVLRQPKQAGLAVALNAGLAQIETTWVVRADADDINYPQRFETQAAALVCADPPLDLMGCAIQETDLDGAPMNLRRTLSHHEEICAFASQRNPFNHMTVWYRTALVRQIGGYPDIHLKEDYALWASMIHAGARCYNLPDVLVDAMTGKAMYRRRGGLKYARSEIQLQRHLWHMGLKSRFRATFDGVARAVVFLMPAGLRSAIYERFLRARVRAS